MPSARASNNGESFILASPKMVSMVARATAIAVRCQDVNTTETSRAKIGDRM